MAKKKYEVKMTVKGEIIKIIEAESADDAVSIMLNQNQHQEELMEEADWECGIIGVSGESYDY